MLAMNEALRDIPVVYGLPAVTATAVGPTTTTQESDSDSVTSDEIQWMLRTRPLAPAPDRQLLAHHYGDAEADAMLRAFNTAGIDHLVGVLAWPGVATRWPLFVTFCLRRANPPSAAAAPGAFKTPEDAFTAFARSLGRVRTYRALALDDDGYDAILAADEIFPTGRLRGRSAADLDAIVEQHGVRKVVVARLYIAHLARLIGADPSISLHDDWQTTTCIASGYMNAHPSCMPAPASAPQQPVKRIHLFCMSLPVLESLGWRLADVAVHGRTFLGQRYADHAPWFNFKSPAVPDGVWFDSTVQRTERYGLFTVPALKQRLLCVWRFPADVETVARALKPFTEAQAALHDAQRAGEGAEERTVHP